MHESTVLRLARIRLRLCRTALLSLSLAAAAAARPFLLAWLPSLATILLPLRRPMITTAFLRTIVKWLSTSPWVTSDGGHFRGGSFCGILPLFRMYINHYYSLITKRDMAVVVGGRGAKKGFAHTAQRS
jgi:hypothetical protein